MASQRWTEDEIAKQIAKVREHALKPDPSRQAGPGGTITGNGLGRFDPVLAFLKASGLPEPEVEWRFAAPRRWRFDYAWPVSRVAIEVEGGAWTKGRHTRGQGFIGDMSKYNEAVLLGWRVLRFTPDQLAAGSWVPALKQLIG